MGFFSKKIIRLKQIIISSIIISIFFIFLAFNDFIYSPDLKSYEFLFNYINYTLDIEKVFKNFYYEKFFIYVFYFLSTYHENFYSLVFLLSSLTILIKIFIFRNFKYFNYALLTYFILFFFFFELSQLRISFAIIFILIAILFKDSSKHKLYNCLYYLFLGFVGLCFSKIAIVIFFFLFLNKKYIILLLIFILSFLLNDILIFLEEYHLIDLTAYLSSKKAYLYNYDIKPISLKNTLFLSNFFFLIVSIFDYKKLSFVQKKCLFFILICNSIYLFFFNYGHIAPRVFDISFIALIPFFFANNFKINILWIFRFVILFYIILYNFVIISGQNIENFFKIFTL
jgi:hypothetical protein